MKFGKHFLDLDRPRIMGILNVTPDSFYDGGHLLQRGRLDVDKLLAAAQAMQAEGADILDVGGESTRPGASPVTLQQELDRVVPAVEILADRLGLVVSVDTSAAAVMEAACGAGAAMINDVRALQSPGAMQVAAACGVPVCLMHMQGTPGDMQVNPEYGDAVVDVVNFLRQRIAACVDSGVPPDRILVDPGIGFGKSDDHNLALLRNLDKLRAFAPVLVGVSRKSLFGRLLGRSVEDRLAASIATGVMALMNGASILRVHDVSATRDAVQMFLHLSSPAVLSTGFKN